MADTILLNGAPHHFEESALPCLITYEEKSGGSNFSVTVTVDLFLRGSKILFLTAYPMARDNFSKQIGENHSKVAFIANKNDFEGSKSAQAIILESGNEELFSEAMSTLADIDERVILLKNVEKFSDVTITSCLAKEKVILSGHLDECATKDEILKKDFKTVIAFNKTKTSLPFGVVPALEKWTGYLFSEDQQGVVKVEQVNA